MSIGSSQNFLPPPLPYDPSNGGQNATNFAPGGYYNRTGQFGNSGGGLGIGSAIGPGPVPPATFGSVPGPGPSSPQPVNPWGSGFPPMLPGWGGGGGNKLPMPSPFGQPSVQPVNAWGGNGPPGFNGANLNKTPMQFPGSGAVNQMQAGSGSMGGPSRFGRHSIYNREPAGTLNRGRPLSPKLLEYAQGLLQSLNQGSGANRNQSRGFRAGTPWQ